LIVEAPGFGAIVIDGSRYEKDVVLCLGKVFERRKDLSSDRKRVYGHTPLTLKEVELYESMCRDAQSVVIAAGYHGDLPIETDALTHLIKKFGRVLIVKTPGLPGIPSEELSRSLVIIHVTC